MGITVWFFISLSMVLHKSRMLKSVVVEILLSGGEDHVREFLQELKTANLNEEDVIAG